MKVTRTDASVLWLVLVRDPTRGSPYAARFWSKGGMTGRLGLPYDASILPFAGAATAGGEIVEGDRFHLC